MGNGPRRKVLMLEFNELCPSLLQKWMDAGELPNFKRFFEASQAFTTLADAEAPALEPWIQWYSVHTGLDYSQHGVFHLTDGPLRDFPDIWKLVRDGGGSAMNFSSMNAKGFRAPGSVFVPDPWCTSEVPFPEELGVFVEFVTSRVREYSNKDNNASIKDFLAFSKFMAFHGLRPKTIVDTLSYLMSEVMHRQKNSWKRVAVLDWIYRDVFIHYYKKTHPDFATIFLNSTAHLQHSYWRYMEPEKFAARSSPNDIERFGSAVYFGYKNMDSLLGDLFALEASGTTLVLATALSQQPFLKYEDIGGQRFYRARDIHAFMSRFDIKPRVIQPVMTHQYQLRFDTNLEQFKAADQLKAINCNDQPMFHVEVKDDCSLYVGCQLRKEVPDDAELSSAPNGQQGRFYEDFYLIDAVKSGRHHPDGALWFKTGTHKIHPAKVPITDILPTLMDYMQIDCAPSEAHPFKGRSLVPAWTSDVETDHAGRRHHSEPVFASAGQTASARLV